jgi:hypothetical protein
MSVDEDFAASLVVLVRRKPLDFTLAAGNGPDPGISVYPEEGRAWLPADLATYCPEDGR